MSEALDVAAEAILALSRPHPVRVGVEGRSAAGKTTLADALAKKLEGSGRPVLRAEFDDFHPAGHAGRSSSGGYTTESYYAEGYDYAAFRDLLLAPISPGGDRRCRLALHDSFHDKPKGEVIDAPANAIIVIDGAFLSHPLLTGHYDFLIWLDVSFETMIERAAKRDIAWMPSEEIIRTRYRERWIPLHRLHEAYGARDRVDMIIDNEDTAAPRIVRAPRGVLP